MGDSSSTSNQQVNPWSELIRNQPKAILYFKCDENGEVSVEVSAEGLLARTPVTFPTGSPPPDLNSIRKIFLFGKISPRVMDLFDSLSQRGIFDQSVLYFGSVTQFLARQGQDFVERFLRRFEGKVYETWIYSDKAQEESETINTPGDISGEELAQLQALPDYDPHFSSRILADRTLLLCSRLRIYPTKDFKPENLVRWLHYHFEDANMAKHRILYVICPHEDVLSGILRSIKQKFNENPEHRRTFTVNFSARKAKITQLRVLDFKAFDLYKLSNGHIVQGRPVDGSAEVLTMERLKQPQETTYKNSYKFQLRRCTYEEIKNEPKPEFNIGSMMSSYGGNEVKYKDEFYPEEHCQIHIQRQG